MEVFDLTKEKPVSLAQATDFLPRRADGKKVSIRTVERWIRHGHNGVRLEGGNLGITVVTSIESLQRFMERLSAPQPAKVEKRPRTQAQARKSHEKAKSSLAKAGWGKSRQRAGAKS